MRAASATELLRALEKKGFIERIPLEQDGRYKRILPTEKALAYRERVFREIVAANQALTRGISGEELEAFYSVMERMLNNLD